MIAVERRSNRRDGGRVCAVNGVCDGNTGSLPVRTAGFLGTASTVQVRGGAGS